MTDKRATTEIAELGEFGLIDHLLKDNVLQRSSTIKGPGDDAAVLKHGDGLSVVSTDLLVEGIHFDLMYTPLKHLGYKSIAVNVSDICAMNARPEQVTVSLGISNRFSVEALEELYSGIYAACKRFGVDLIGGDTTSSNKGLIISVTAIGRTTEDEVVYRSGAKPGDLLCVSGNLGGAYLGLQLLEREKQLFLENPKTQPDLEDQNYVVGRQLKPEARTDIINMFREDKFRPTSMIDVSDGLTSDLFHICRNSEVGAIIFESQVPIHQDAKLMALKFNMDPITSALNGGEDYEMLFTADPVDLDKIKMMADIYIIGDMILPERGIKLQTEQNRFVDLTAQGWQHF